MLLNQNFSIISQLSIIPSFIGYINLSVLDSFNKFIACSPIEKLNSSAFEDIFDLFLLSVFDITVGMTKDGSILPE